MELGSTKDHGHCFIKGWRPRRSIKLCSWGAEEQGLIGSIEWVEQQSKIIRERAVAYINVDAVVRGNYSLTAKGSPLLKQLMFQESKAVQDPRDESKKYEKPWTLYQRWIEKRSDGSGVPKFSSLGSGSDYVPFYQFLGKTTCHANDILYLFRIG